MSILQFNFMSMGKGVWPHGLSCTIVLDVSGLLLGLVHRNTVDLHSDQRIYYRILLDVDFGQLLTTDHLKHINTASIKQ